jgi:hypothetical protein
MMIFLKVFLELYARKIRHSAQGLLIANKVLKEHRYN